ncbi:hypothetical protein ACTQX0_06155 [Lactobacillus amylovorus]|uniref:hypothetical protein n=1 Tax=Lactobacillus amylovorus TaxID=1604 RepID=UPI003F9B3B65
MEAKSGKGLKEAVNYQRIIREREEYAGWDCLTVVVGNAVHAIGQDCEYRTPLAFIEEQLADDPDKFMIQGQFTDAKDMYKYLFENCDNCEELTSFLEDYFDGMEMADYGR